VRRPCSSLQFFSFLFFVFYRTEYVFGATQIQQTQPLFQYQGNKKEEEEGRRRSRKKPEWFKPNKLVNKQTFACGDRKVIREEKVIVT